MKPNTILALSIPLISLIIVVSAVGLLTPGFYSKETGNWVAQSIGQDMIDLFLIVPSLMITSVFTARKSRIAAMLWGGVNLYLVYTFTIYCFNIHFNGMFLLYCFSLGLSFYSFSYFLFSFIKEPMADWFKAKAPFRFIGIYFLVIPVVFYALWLSDVLPSIVNDKTPKSLADTGLFTNPVHVIDLSIFLPGLFLTGVLVLKRKNTGMLLAPVLLTFFVLMDITIGALIIVMKAKGFPADYSVTIAMSVLAIFSMVLLIIYMRSIRLVTGK